MPSVPGANFVMSSKAMLIFRKSQALWINLQDKIFAPGANPTNFSSLKKEGENLLLTVADVMEAWNYQVRTIRDIVDNPEALRAFIELGTEYFDVYSRMCHLLYSIITRLNIKTQDIQSYAFSTYKADFDKYHALTEQYTELGNKMQSEMSELQNIMIEVKPRIQNNAAKPGSGCLVSFALLITILVLLPLLI